MKVENFELVVISAFVCFNMIDAYGTKWKIWKWLLLRVMYIEVNITESLVFEANDGVVSSFFVRDRFILDRTAKRKIKQFNWDFKHCEGLNFPFSVYCFSSGWPETVYKLSRLSNGMKALFCIVISNLWSALRGGVT